MKRESQFLPPRQSVIYAATRRMLDETATNANTFAMAVAERYLATVAPDVRNVPFKLGEGDELMAALKSNGQQLRRYMDGTVKSLPADLEDAWVSALPEPYRNACERDLAKRRGMLSVPSPDVGVGGQIACVAALSSEFGALLTALAPALADGKIDEADRPHAKRILEESADLIARVVAIQKAITAVLPEGATHG